MTSSRPVPWTDTTALEAVGCRQACHHRRAFVEEYAGAGAYEMSLTSLTIHGR